MPEITSLSQLDPDKYYTYSDYMTWKFQERVELFLGKVLKMSPAPNVNHQRISVNLTLLLGASLKDRLYSYFSCTI
ncbi:MAG: hypothetical protein V3V00_16255 [Saprospiraceae bacterium]